MIAFWEDQENGLQGQPSPRIFRDKVTLLRFCEGQMHLCSEATNHTRQAYKMMAASHGAICWSKLIKTLQGQQSMEVFEAGGEGRVKGWKGPINLSALLSHYLEKNVPRTQDILDRDPAPKQTAPPPKPDLAFLEDAEPPRRSRVASAVAAPATAGDEANEE
jgi:hypothetical protein